MLLLFCRREKDVKESVRGQVANRGRKNGVPSLKDSHLLPSRGTLWLEEGNRSCQTIAMLIFETESFNSLM